MNTEYSEKTKYLRAIILVSGLGQNGMARLIGLEQRLMRSYCAKQSSRSYKEPPEYIMLAVKQVEGSSGLF